MNMQLSLLIAIAYIAAAASQREQGIFFPVSVPALSPAATAPARMTGKTGKNPGFSASLWYRYVVRVLTESQTRYYQLFDLWKSVVLGGLTPISPGNANVESAAEYAVSVSYPSVETESEVISAKYQTTNGYLYYVDVAVTLIEDESCSMQNFVVQEAFSDGSHKLISKKALTSQQCPST